MLHLLLLSALAVGPVFDPVIVRPGLVQADGGTGNVVRTNSITANYPLVVQTDGGSVRLGLTAPYCVGVDRGLGFDSGFFCQVWDAGSPLISHVTGTSPIIVTPDGGRGVNISFNAAALDAGTVKVVTGTSPIVVNPDAGGGYDVTFPSWATTAAWDRYLSMTGVDTGTCETTACRTWAYTKTTIPYRIRHNGIIHIDGGVYNESLDTIGLSLEPNLTTVDLTFEGPPQTATTVATGTNTGHATAVSNGAGTDYSYITDIKQTWTTDDLQGAWADFAGVKYLIARNTATRLTIPNTLSPVPAVDAGYTIMRPAATFDGGALTALDMEHATTGINARVQVTDMAFTSGLVGVRNLTRARLTMTTSSVTGGALLAQNTSTSQPPYAGYQVTNSFWKGASPTVHDSTFSSGSVVKLTSGQFTYQPSLQGNSNGAFYVEPTGGNGPFLLRGPGWFTATSLFLHCITGSQYGLYMQGGLGDNQPITGSFSAGSNAPFANITNLLIDNCLRPVVVAGEAQLSVQTTANLTGQLTAADQSTAITVNDGASVKLLPAPTISDAGIELSMDSDRYSFYNVSNTATKALRNLLTGSYYKQSTASAGGFSATGGTVTDVGGYRIHTFTTSGTFTVTGTGSVDVLVVAGGGSGGYSRGGGGGAGGVIVSAGYAVSTGAIAVTVGAGGAAATSTGNNGGNSVFDSLTAIGGGAGATSNGGATAVAGNSGGSGGGGTGLTASAPPAISGTGGTATALQGNAGGYAYSDNSVYIACGGGGGAGAAGGNATAGVGGAGGAGLSNSYSGAAVTYAGGGGSGGGGTYTPGAGGSGGGGGGQVGVAGGSGTANTGSGGGGSGFGQTGGAGGSGIVIVRYVYP